MKKAFVFPGQGAQYPGMGKELYDKHPAAKILFDEADSLLGYELSNTMFNGTEEELKQTSITQPAIFLHSVVLYKVAADKAQPDMVAGHSLGEFSALVANGTLDFGDGLKLVQQRADAMQRACDQQPSTMAAVLGLDDATIEKVCAGIDEVVVPANYNCPGQVVISGSVAGVEQACDALKAAGAKRALMLKVAGAFHSPLMEPPREELEQAINDTPFHTPQCPVYQNVNAQAVTAADAIKGNLIKQLTAPVRWTQSVQQMLNDGAGEFTECGPGKVLSGLIKKIDRNATLGEITY